MQHVLRTIGGSELVEIDETSFVELKKAKEALVTMIGVEQKFDLLVENYFDYERELFELALRHSLRFDSEWASFQGDIAGVSRRVANLLSAAKLYLDQTQHDLRALRPSSWSPSCCCSHPRMKSVLVLDSYASDEVSTGWYSAAYGLASHSLGVAARAFRRQTKCGNGGSEPFCCLGCPCHGQYGALAHASAGKCLRRPTRGP